MDFEQLMIEYFDGVISEENRTLMFQKMNEDSSLVIDFNHFWLVDYAGRRCVDSFAPPTYVVNEIYSRLGYSIPPGLVKVNSRLPLFSKANLPGNLLSGLIGVTLTLAVMFLFFYPNSGNRSIAKPNKIYQTATTHQGQLPVTESRESTEYSKNKHGNKFIPSVAKKDEYSMQSEFVSENEENITSTNIFSDTDNKIENVNAPITDLHYNLNEKHKPFLLKSNEPLGLTMSISNTPSWNLAKERIDINSVSPFNNLSFSLYYDLSEYFKIGAEARQETYYTEYTGSEPNDTTYQYFQQSNLTTISANARFYPYDIWQFKTYLGFIIGLNKGGIIARPNFGFEYAAYPDLSFALGLEYSYFYFRHQNSWSGASKIGVNYGVIMKF